MEVVQAQVQGDSSGEEEDEEDGEADIEDSQILEDLPDETEVCCDLAPLSCVCNRTKYPCRTLT